MTRKRWAHVALVLVISAIVPTAILSIPGWIQSFFESVDERERAEAAAERRAARGPLTDLAPRRAPQPADPAADREQRLARRAEALWGEMFAEAEESAPLDDNELEEEFAERVRPEHDRRDFDRAEAARQYVDRTARRVPAEFMPEVPLPSTETLVSPALWPEPPNPYDPPPVKVNTSRSKPYYPEDSQ